MLYFTLFIAFKFFTDFIILVFKIIEYVLKNKEDRKQIGREPVIKREDTKQQVPAPLNRKTSGHSGRFKEEHPDIKGERNNAMSHLEA